MDRFPLPFQVPAPEYAALRSKVTRRLVPFLVLLYLVAFLDRVNVGFAALTMNKDLGITPYFFGWGAGIFFLGYFLLEVPSNLALEKFGARFWIARIMITWGVISAAMALAGGPASFLLLRFLLGLAEAGFFPGIVLFLSYWYPARERARVMAMLYLGIPLANIIGAPISASLLNLDGFWRLHGWQWLFIIEGLPAVLLAFVTLGFLTDRPEKAAWLSEEERTILSKIMQADNALSERASGRMTLRGAFSHPRVLLLALIFFLVVMGVYGLGFWLPQIIKGFGVPTTEVGFLAAIPYLVAAVVQVFWCRHSDNAGERRWHFAIPCFLIAGGFAMSALSPSPYVSFVGLIFSAIGVMCAQPMFWTMPSAILTGTAVAGGIALINSIGNLGGFAGPYLVGWVANSTKNPALGLIVLTCAVLMAAGLVLAMRPEMVGERDRKPPKAAAASVEIP
jgi:MFS transporter, ACS family, tartrate transporter